MRGTILHSDQGFQYTSHAYNKRLLDLGIIGDHSRKGDCHDNACIESFFSHFKSEMLYLNHFKTEADLIQAIEEYIYFYNYKRFQKRLNHGAPIEYRISMVASLFIIIYLTGDDHIRSLLLVLIKNDTHFQNIHQDFFLNLATAISSWADIIVRFAS